MHNLREAKMPAESTSHGVPAAPDFRAINYQVTNKELTGAIQKALGDEGNPSARVFVGESPGREGWAIRCLIVEGGPKSTMKLVMFPSGANATNLVTQRHRVMTWVRLEVLLDQVQKWLGGDARVSLMFNWMKITGIDA